MEKQGERRAGSMHDSVAPGERSGDVRLAVLRERRAAAWRSGLTELLERRPELHGVHRPADFAAEAVLWSA